MTLHSGKGLEFPCNYGGVVAVEYSQVSSSFEEPGRLRRNVVLFMWALLSYKTPPFVMLKVVVFTRKKERHLPSRFICRITNRVYSKIRLRGTVTRALNQGEGRGSLSTVCQKMDGNGAKN